MRNQNDGDALAVVQLLEDAHDFSVIVRVQGAGGFVGKKNLKGVDQRPRNSYSLLLATRKAEWKDSARDRPDPLGPRVRLAAPVATSAAQLCGLETINSSGAILVREISAGAALGQEVGYLSSGRWSEVSEAIRNP